MKNKKVPHRWGTPGTIMMFWVETRGKVWLLLTNRRLYCPMLLVACVHAQPRNQVGYPGESTKVENSGESEPSSSSQPSSEQNLRTSRSLRYRSSKWSGLIVGRIDVLIIILHRLSGVGPTEGSFETSDLFPYPKHVTQAGTSLLGFRGDRVFNSPFRGESMREHLSLPP